MADVAPTELGKNVCTASYQQNAPTELRHPKGRLFGIGPQRAIVAQLWPQPCNDQHDEQRADAT